MQEAVQVSDYDSLRSLNRKLADGWKVIHTCPMPSSVSVSVAGEFPNRASERVEPTCLVIIEKVG